MGIEQSKNSHYEKEVITRGGGRYSETVYPWICRCDFCGKDAYKWGETPGDAADNARKDGFTTVPAKVVALPSKWSCKSCKEKADDKSLPASLASKGKTDCFPKLRQTVLAKKAG